MSVSLKIEEDGSGSLEIWVEGDLTVQHAAEFRMCLSEALGRAQSVRVNMEALEDMDLTCLQLLCSAHKAALTAGRVLSIHDDRPERLEGVLNLAGFSRSRGCSVDLNNSCLWILQGR